MRIGVKVEAPAPRGRHPPDRHRGHPGRRHPGGGGARVDGLRGRGCGGGLRWLEGDAAESCAAVDCEDVCHWLRGLAGVVEKKVPVWREGKAGWEGDGGRGVQALAGPW